MPDLFLIILNFFNDILHFLSRPQYQAYTELGRAIAENVPFVRVCDVITFMPQINYMVSVMTRRFPKVTKSYV